MDDAILALTPYLEFGFEFLFSLKALESYLELVSSIVDYGILSIRSSAFPQFLAV